jgi:ribonuclease BN (tRNA processing enzyme)
MKLYTLGTSHGACEPSRGCSGTLINIDGDFYLFDCGGNIEGKMTDLGLPIENIKGIFISHMHEDHAGGLSAIVKRFCVYICKKSVNIFLPEENGISAFRGWFSALHLPNEHLLNFNPVTEGEIYSDEKVRIKAIPTKHIAGGKFPSFAYGIEACGKRIIYTGDLSSDFCDYPDVIFRENIDLVISELTHFDVERSFKKIAKSNTKKIVFTHIYPGKDDLLLGAADKLDFDFALASDGDCFEI